MHIIKPMNANSVHGFYSRGVKNLKFFSFTTSVNYQYIFIFNYLKNKNFQKKTLSGMNYQDWKIIGVLYCTIKERIRKESFLWSRKGNTLDRKET